MFNNIYKGKRVFLTGHTGFKGSWLSLWLTKLGADVCGYSLAPDTVDLNDLGWYPAYSVEKGLESMISAEKSRQK